MTTAQVGEPLAFGLLDAPDNGAQRNYLNHWLYRNNFLAGRGAGKTVAMVAKDAIHHAIVSQDIVTYMTEQTGPDVRDVLLPAVLEIVPRDWYEIHGPPTAFDIHWKMGGGTGITRCRSRISKSSTGEPPFRGPSAAAVRHDELGLDRFRARKAIEVSEGMLRGSDLLCLDICTTPKLGELYDYLRRLNLVGESPAQFSKDSNGLDAAAFYGTTADNVYNNDLDARLRATYSAEFYAQECLAQWISLSGRVWDTWSDETWPTGNVYPGEYGDWGSRYRLSVDLGVRGAWGVWQIIPAIDPVSGRLVRRTALDCLVAEWQTDGGNALEMIDTIDRTYGRPAEVVIGADAHTRSVATGIKPSVLFSRQWGNVPLLIPRGHLADKETQHWATQAAICNGTGQRSVVLATGCRHHTPDSGRTLPDLLRLDTWPEGSQSAAAYFSKDKSSGGVGLEDERDMLLYYCTMTHPPEARKERVIR